MLDAVGTTGGTATTSHDEGIRALHQRNAVLVQRQQVMERHRKIVKALDEGPIRVHDDLTVTPPSEPLNPAQVGIVLVLRELRQGFNQLLERVLRLATEHEIQ